MVGILRCRGTVRDLQVVDEPVHDAAHAFGHLLDKNRIIAVLADAEDVLRGKLGRVLRLVHGLALEAGARGDQRARVERRSATNHRHLFNEDHLGAERFGTNGGGDARAARTDHDHVGLFLDESGGSLLRHDSRRERGGIAARLPDGVGHGGADALARERGAGDGVNLEALGVDDARRHLLDGRVRNADRLDMLHNANGGKLSCVNLDLDGQLAVPALPDARVCAVRHGRGSGRTAEDRGNGRDRCQKLEGLHHVLLFGLVGRCRLSGTTSRV